MKKMMSVHDKYQKYKVRSIRNILAISIVSVQQIYATGCPTQFVSEHIKNAKTALESGNMEEVKNQLQLAEDALAMAGKEGDSQIRIKIIVR